MILQVTETTELAKVDSKDNHNGSADQKQQVVHGT